MRPTPITLVLGMTFLAAAFTAEPRFLAAADSPQLFATAASQDEQQPNRDELDDLLQKGGEHWSVPEKMRGLDAPAADTFVYLTPKEDRVFELKHDERGKYTGIIELKWTKAAGTSIPVSPVKNVRTHIYYHQLQDTGSWAFGGTRSIIAARENTGTLNFTVSTQDAFEGERDLLFHITTNGNPGQPVANFLKLKVRISE